MRVNKKILAKKLGRSERCLTTWQRDGLPVLEHGRRGQQNVYDLGAVVAWIKRTGCAMDLRLNRPAIDIAGLERELGLTAPSAPAPPKFPDPRTIREIEEAMAASLVHSAAILVRLIGIDPEDAIKAWEVITGEMTIEFEDVCGWDSGPCHTVGDSRALQQVDGRVLFRERIRRYALELDQSTVDNYIVDDDESGAPDGR